MLKTLLFFTGSLFAAFIYLMLPKQHCVCGVKIPEGGGMASQQMLCECGEYYHKAVNESFHRMIIRREDELKRIKEEKRKGNDYDTFL